MKKEKFQDNDEILMKDKQSLKYSQKDLEEDFSVDGLQSENEHLENIKNLPTKEKSRDKLKKKRIKKFTIKKQKNIDRGFIEHKEKNTDSNPRKTVEPQIYDYYLDTFARSKLKTVFFIILFYFLYIQIVYI